MNPDTTRTVLVLHSNRSMTRLAQLNAAKHGIEVVVARNVADLIAKSKGNIRPDAIVLSNDLKNPSTDEIVKMLNSDPRLRGTRVVVLKGLLGSISDILKAFRIPPPTSMK